MSMTYYYQSPLGWLRLVRDGQFWTAINFVPRRPSGGVLLSVREGSFRSLERYFAKKDKGLSLPIRLLGTPFQKRVWNALRRLPYGSTVSYGRIAQRIGRSTAVRAVASAIGSNPLAVVVPCHRVIGKDGSLTGYAFGLPKKNWLLRHEGAIR